MNNFYAFAHIPKTAGTSFYQILERNFGRSFVHVPSHGITEGAIASEAIERFIVNNGYIKALGGHRVRLNLPWHKITGVDLYAISYVRNPIERLRSEYYYLKTLKLDAQGVFAAQSYEECIHTLIQDETELVKFASYQFRYLTGGSNITTIDALMANDNIVIFPMEHFLESCAILQFRFPNDFKDCSYVVRNVGPRIKKEKQTKSENQLELVFKQIENNDFALWDAVQAKSIAFQEANQERLHKIKNRIFRKNIMRKYTIAPLQSFFEKANNYTKWI